MPLGVSLLLQAFPVEEHGMPGPARIAAVVAPALGPILGGWLVSLNLWRSFSSSTHDWLLGVLMGLRYLRSHSTGNGTCWMLGILTEIAGLGHPLCASIAADQGWTALDTLLCSVSALWG